MDTTTQSKDQVKQNQKVESRIHPLTKKFYSNLDFLEFKINKRTNSLLKHQQLGTKHREDGHISMLCS